MKLPDITEWLATGGSFRRGAELYAALGQSPTYQRLFALGETSFSSQALRRELAALVEAAPPVVVPTAPVAAPEAPQAARPTPAAPVPAADPAALADVRQRLKAVRDERSHIHPHLTAPRTGQKSRLTTALRILELTDREVQLREDEAHVLAHGRLPGPVATADLADAGELRRRLTNLLSLRSKLKKRPDRADDLAQAEADIILIRSKLNL